MKNTYRLSIRLYGLMLLIGAMALALSLTARAQSPIPPVSWQRIINENSVPDPTVSLAQSADGGCAIVSIDKSYLSVITKLNAAGGVEWTTPLTTKPIPNSVQAMSDGGFLFLGRYDGVSNGLVLIRVGPTGAIIYRKPLDLQGLPTSTKHTYSASSLIATPDGGFLVSGTQNFASLSRENFSNILLVKLDKEGNTTWTKTYLGDGATQLTGSSGVTVAPEGGYLVHSTTDAKSVTGVDDKSVSVIYNFRVDEQGAIVWQRVGNPSITFIALARSGDGYVAIGKYPDQPGLSVLKLNRDLDIIKVAQLTDTESSNFYYFLRTSLKPTADGGCIVVGSYAGSGRDYRITKFNAELAIDWQEKGGGSGNDEALSIVVNPDGTYFIAGSTNSPDFPGRTDNSINTVIWVRKQAAKANTQALTLIAPTYNCTTGAITFNTTGGDGSTITYQAPGIIRSSLTSNTGTVEQGLRNDPKPITIQATQSGQTTSFTFDLKAACSTTTPGLPSPIAANVEDQQVRLGQSLTYPAIEIGSGKYNPAISDDYRAWAISAQGLPPGLSLTTSVLMKTFFLVSINGTATQVGVYPVTVTAVNTRAPQNLPFITTFTITVVNNSTGTGLTLTAPTYDCATGAFKFNTTGGDGSPITYSAPGITGPTTNPNQFVDAGLRQAADAQPLTLSATQNGVTVMYRFDLRATCPIGTNPPVPTNNDRAILVDLYNSTNGPSWARKTYWLQGDSPCNWDGVSCDVTGRVTRLYLSNNNLTGTLPSSLSNLSQLTSLDLGVNELLVGTLPAGLGNLSQLTYLNLGATQLSGEIPASYANLSKLVSLLVGGSSNHCCTLTGSIPASLGNLTKLKSLNIAHTAITGEIPASLGNLSNLEDLNLSFNRLSGSIPVSLSNLSNLQVLYLNDNQLSGSIPAFLGNLPQLQQLALGNNSLSGCLPTELRSLCGKLVSLTNNPSLPGDGDFASFCSNGTGVCSTTPTTGGLVLTAPTYNCTTGAITFNTTGGNGSSITYQAPGIIRSSLTSNTGTVEQGLRNDPKPITIQATQSGKTTSYLFDFGAFCKKDDIRLFGVDTTFFVSTYFDYKVGEVTTEQSNPIERWSKTVTNLPPGIYYNFRLLDDLKTYGLYIFGSKDNRVGNFPITITVINPLYPNLPVSSNLTLTFKSRNPTTGLTLIEPTYNCATGAFRFNTVEGNGTTIEYIASGITDWTTNPNQFVDQQSRTANDVKPFVLMARQSGNVVTYTWDLKQTCGRARVATEEAGSTLSLQLLGNPVHETVQVLIKGAEGQPVQLRLTDVRGRLLESRAIEQAGAEEMQQFKLDPSAGPGMLFLQATKEQQTRTVKIIRQ